MNKYYCFNRTSSYKDRIESVIQKKKGEVFDFFEVDNNQELNFNIYVYNSVSDLVLGMKNRGFSEMPDYMCACQKDEDNSINFYEPSDEYLENDWCKDEYDNVIFHESIHAIQFMLYGSKPEWLSEGIAKYLDGTYKNGIKSLLENFIHKSRIPNMSELINSFGMYEYDSYDYAYLMVSYLIDKFGKQEFLKIINDDGRLNEISDNLVIKAICYYNNKYFGNEFYNANLNNPNWLFHGSSIKLDEIVVHLSHDSNGVDENIDKAIFLTSSMNIASAYAFKDTIKRNSNGLSWDFSINNIDEIPIMRMKNVRVSDDIVGYIYVFSNDGSFKNEPEGLLQFKSFNSLKPVDYLEITYRDYKHLYEVV